MNDIIRVLVKSILNENGIKLTYYIYNNKFKSIFFQNQLRPEN